MIHQQRNIKETLKKYGIDQAKPIDTPNPTSARLVADEDRKSVEEKTYRGMISSLLYLTTSV